MMNTWRRFAAIISIASALTVSTASAALTYSQNFDGMGTGTAAPAGWSVYSITGDHSTFAPADSITPGTALPAGLPTGNTIKGGTLASTLVAATASGQKASSGYNWAVGGSTTNRSLGTSPTGTAGMVLQAVINNTDGAIDQLAIDYDVLVQTTTVNNNNYGGTYAGKEELPGYWLFYSLDNGVTYTNVSDLNGDGHTWANAKGTVHESTTVTLSSTWASGTNLYLRFFDDNAQGPSPDQNLGLDNLVIQSVQSVPEPASMSLLAVGALALIKRKRA